MTPANTQFKEYSLQLDDYINREPQSEQYKKLTVIKQWLENNLSGKYTTQGSVLKIINPSPDQEFSIFFAPSVVRFTNEQDLLAFILTFGKV